MGRGEQFWEKLTEGVDLTEEALPGLSVVEIAGTGRVLIENHFGVVSYSRELIRVKVKYGCVQVCGCQLEIRRMNRNQLTICGQIETVSLHRRR